MTRGLLMHPAPSPFTVAVSDAEIDDLRRRLHATRWPGPATVDGWKQGVPEAYVQELCRYWADEYDWPARQELLNAVPQYLLDVQGLPIHFLHVPSPVERGFPASAHPWLAGSVAEFFHVIGPPTAPAAHGGNPADAFPSWSPHCRATAGAAS
jgi:epoxide hydrolase